MLKPKIVLVILLLTSTGLVITQCSQTPPEPQKGSKQVAEEFVKTEATFRFDGIPETFNLTGTKPVTGGEEFTFEFDSRQAGYGDRTGKFLAQVITHHRAVVTIEAGKVKSAIMDGRWDMIRQQVI